MTTGPIEFISDRGPDHTVAPTEMGGADGLIQPAIDVVLQGDPEASGGHTLEGDTYQEVQEVAGIMARRAMQPVDVVRGIVLDAAIAADGADARDPVTGRVAPSTINKAGGSPGELTDLAPY